MPAGGTNKECQLRTDFFFLFRIRHSSWKTGRHSLSIQLAEHWQDWQMSNCSVKTINISVWIAMLTNETKKIIYDRGWFHHYKTTTLFLDDERNYYAAPIFCVATASAIWRQFSEFYWWFFPKKIDIPNSQRVREKLLRIIPLFIAPILRMCLDAEQNVLTNSQWIWNLKDLLPTKLKRDQLWAFFSLSSRDRKIITIHVEYTWKAFAFWYFSIFGSLIRCFVPIFTLEREKNVSINTVMACWVCGPLKFWVG